MARIANATGGTGNSAIAAVERIKETNPRSIKFVCLTTDFEVFSDEDWTGN